MVMVPTPDSLLTKSLPPKLFLELELSVHRRIRQELNYCLSVNKLASGLTDCLSVDELASGLTDCLSVDEFASGLTLTAPVG